MGKTCNSIKIALISDALTHSCLAEECVVKPVTPANYKRVLADWKPDLLFVESVWQGHEHSWKYKVASYAGKPWRNNRKLRKVVEYAQDRGIPAVFWNKEDGVHFDRFIKSASLFDYIFTVDANCVERYQNLLGESKTVETLMFPIQPETHRFTGFDFKHNKANFVGSYSHHIHNRRRMWQDLMFNEAAGMGIAVFDRNSDRKSTNYRYPDFHNLEVFPAVPHEQTAQIYKDYLVSLNVNTIEDSKTMYSRRLVEILACGGIAVTNPSPAVDHLFKDYCHVVHDADSAKEIFGRLRHGPSKDDLEMARAGSEYVMKEHTWAHRMEDVARVVGL